MLNKLNKYLPRVTWKTDDEEKTALKAKNEELISLIKQIDSINAGLNVAIGEANSKNVGVKQEAVSLLSAIVLQHGGELTVKHEFREALASDETNQMLKIDVLENQDVYLILVQQEESEEDDN
jgi:hypothetical protein